MHTLPFHFQALLVWGVWERVYLQWPIRCNAGEARSKVTQMDSAAENVKHALWTQMRAHTHIRTHRDIKKEIAILTDMQWHESKITYGKSIKIDMSDLNACVCIQSFSKCVVFREDTGFPWGDSAVLWAWASHPVTMDHCIALSEGENMCMYVWVNERVFLHM